jgi:hypothetical protein
MNTATPAIRELAQRLIALETAREPSDGPGGAAVRVCGRLREPLARLAGVAGFRSLLTRALALAKAEVSLSDTVEVRADGSLVAASGGGHRPGEGEAAVVAHLLGLLVTFIGGSLTRQLIRDMWPDAVTDEADGPLGGQP